MVGFLTTVQIFNGVFNLDKNNSNSNKEEKRNPIKFTMMV
jgi:hypothetical protein